MYSVLKSKCNYYEQSVVDGGTGQPVGKVNHRKLEYFNNDAAHTCKVEESVTSLRRDAMIAIKGGYDVYSES